MLQHTDERVKVTTEVLQGIRAVKSYSWEAPFASELMRLRSQELRAWQMSANALSLITAVLSAAPAVVAAITLCTYGALGNVLTPARVFTALALFDQLQTPLIFYPLVLQTLTEGKISLDRLEKYLESKEVEQYVNKGGDARSQTILPTASSKLSVLEEPPRVAHKRSYRIDPEIVVRISRGDFSWLTTHGAIAEDRAEGNVGRLYSADMAVRRGELVAVIGPVGSGKSTLLAALLGELVRNDGEVVVNGRVAYVPQAAWIPNDSLRDVILFGRPYDEKRYQDVLRVCGLEKDLLQLDNGDATEIGERGTNLSGGQKQRVSIARAAYDDADVYILDDPLSALDSEVGSAVFKDCIKTFLEGRTRLLVTHQLSVLPQVDRIILMGKTPSGCRIIDQGTFSELVSRGHDICAIARECAEEQAQTQDVAEAADAFIAADEELPAEDKIADDFEDVDYNLDESILDYKQPEVVLASVSSNSEEQHVSSDAPGSKLMTAEERAAGGVRWSVYKAYFRAAGPLAYKALGLIALVISCGGGVAQQYLVAAWSADPTYIKRSKGAYLWGMALLASSVGCAHYLRLLLNFLMGSLASEKLHNELAARILRAPLSYFETTPAGRILQRFSKDLDDIDTQLPAGLDHALSSFVLIAFHTVGICAITPSFAAVMLPTVIAYYFVTNYYRLTALQLKRLDSVSRSPVYSHFSEALGGMSVIRCFGKGQEYALANERKLDDNLAAYFALETSDRWLSVRLDTIGGVVVLASTVLALASRAVASSAGLSLTNALYMTGFLHWAVRNAVDSEALMNSVERVLYTARHTPQEKLTYVNIHDAARPIKLSPLPIHQTTSNASSTLLLRDSGWPWKGGVVINNVTLRYKEDSDPVLRGVRLDILPGESVGIVGRTGSGKSSLFRALLRLTELESGSITLDGVDIAEVELGLLRSSVSIIPQEPVLFSGSVRYCI